MNYWYDNVWRSVIGTLLNLSRLGYQAMPCLAVSLKVLTTSTVTMRTYVTSNTSIHSYNIILVCQEKHRFPGAALKPEGVKLLVYFKIEAIFISKLYNKHVAVRIVI